MARPRARYRYLGDLGAGAHGAVLRVEDRQRDGARCALKALGAADPAERADLAHEFARLAAVDHPALPRVHELGVLAEPLGPLPAGTLYFTADEIEGQPLSALAPLSGDDRAAVLWAVAVDVAGALAAIHAEGLVHCDVAPQNILVVDRGAAVRAVLVDLGLAVGDGIRGAARGTPRFMAPEALAGVVHPRSDLYGLGASLFHAARGVAPFEGEGAALVDAIRRAPRPRLSDDEAPGLAALIDRLLAADPDARPRTAHDVLAIALAARGALPGVHLPAFRTVAPPARRAARVAGILWPAAAHVVDDLAAARAAARALVLDGASEVAADHGVPRDSAEANARIAPRLVHGPIGSGARAVVAEAIRRDQIAATLQEVAPSNAELSGTLEAVAVALGISDAAADSDAPVAISGGDDQRAHALARRVLAAAGARTGATTVIDLIGDERAAAVIAAAGEPGTGLVILVHEDANEVGTRTTTGSGSGTDTGSGSGSGTDTGSDSGSGTDSGSGSGTDSGSGSGSVSDDATKIPPSLVAHRLDAVSADELRGVAAAALDVDAGAIDRAWVRDLHEVSRGLPAVALAVIASLAADGDDPRAHRPTGAATGAALRVRLVDAAGPDVALVARALAAWRDGASAEELTETVAALALPTAPPGDGAPRTALPAAPPGDGAVRAALRRLRAQEAAITRDDRVLIAPALVDTLAAETPPPLRAACAQAVASVAQRRRLPPARWADVLIELPRVAAHGGPLVAAAEHAVATGRPRRALALARAAAELPGPPGARGALLLARAAIATGAYDDARAAVAQAARHPAHARAARLLGARLHQRAGELDRAEAILAELAAADPLDPDVVGPRARMLVSRGRYREADDAVVRLGALPRTSAGALCAEAAGAARLYLGDADGALAMIEIAADIGRDRGDLALTGRALALRGMIAQQRGDLPTASAHYRDAAVAAEGGGDVHSAAIAQLNHAAALAERGHHGAALPVLTAAIATLAALGRVAELAAAEANRAVSLLAVGEVAAAADVARSARDRAAAAGLPVARFYAELVIGDVARRRDDRAAATAAYQAAWTTGTAAGLPDRGHAQRALAEVATTAAAATAALAAAAALDATDDDRARTLLARGRVALHDLSADDPRQLGDALAAAADRARADDRRDRAWRAAWLAAALAHRAGDTAVAAARAQQARADLAALVAATPDAWHAGLASDPDARALEQLDDSIATAAPHAPGPQPRPAWARLGSAASADAPHPSPAARASADTTRSPTRPSPGPGHDAEVLRLRRLLTLSRRLNAEPQLDRLLDEVIDTAIELTHGERGFLLLARGADVEVVVARGFATDALGPSAISRSIADRAIATGEPVITVDAGHDERFDRAASVAALRLRSVIAVPMHQRGRVIGCIYVDHRLRTSAFDDEAATWLLELADIAAVAIATATLVAAERRDAAAIAELNRRLAAEVADRDAELAVVRAAVPRDRNRPGLSAIIGDSAPIAAVLALAERAAQVALPVVVVGESGTGKELVARAVHDAGPRRDRPFVAINCSAMPETLLESELFGHVRGAFTGADRDRKGLFEVADGGTLFLDEIADTGPAMQAKLLRVVQDGVVRRVGDERVHKVDVRLVAATRTPLADLVAAGRFRDDLRFRLDVIAIPIPPLRARPDDLPALVAHLLARICPDRPPPRLTRDAARALARHAWPGNVRELENALARAVALGSDPITPDDLPESVRTPTAAPASRPLLDGDLALRPAVDALERAHIDAALARTNHNQTAAARLLGLSRFGLQKKLRRLAGDPPSDDD